MANNYQLPNVAQKKRKRKKLTVLHNSQFFSLNALESIKWIEVWLRNSGKICNSLLLIVSTNLFKLSDSRCLSCKLDSEALDGAVVALSLRTYKFLSSPPGAAFFGVLPMATIAISGVPICRARLNSTPCFFFSLIRSLCKRYKPASSPHLIYDK